MAIDSVGGGDPSYSTRRRALEEERARELNRIEQKNKEDVARAQEQRDRSLRDIYANQSQEIDSRQSESQEKVDRARQAADNRIKSFENDSARLTEEAKRQFQAKAQHLSKTSQELDEQRKHLIKQHHDSMETLKKQREDAFEKTHLQGTVEANRIYGDQQKKFSELRERGDTELSRVRMSIADEKAKERAIGERELANLKYQRDDNRTAIEKEINFAERSGQNEMNRKRETLAAQRMQTESDFEDEMSNLRSTNSAAVNRAQIQGKRTLAQTREILDQERGMLTKDARKNLHNQQAQHAMVMNTLESNAHIAEDTAKKGFNERQTRLHEQTDKVLAEHTKATRDLREKTEKEYRENAKRVTQERDGQLKNQIKTLQDELAFQRKLGTKQVNAAALQNEFKLSDHTVRAQDPFYRIHNMNAQVQDSEQEYVIKLRIPEHEHQGVRLSKQDQTVTISGTRRFENHATDENGQRVSTNSYQSYSQTIPYKGRLEMSKLSRDYANGELTIRIPKG